MFYGLLFSFFASILENQVKSTGKYSLCYFEESENPSILKGDELSGALSGHDGLCSENVCVCVCAGNYKTLKIIQMNIASRKYILFFILAPLIFLSFDIFFFIRHCCIIWQAYQCAGLWYWQDFC